MVWLSENWPALLAIISMLLGASVAIAQLAHADSVAKQLKAVKDSIDKVVPPESKPKL